MRERDDEEDDDEEWWADLYTQGEIEAGLGHVAREVIAGRMGSHGVA